ncbi:MAG: GAF and ANTAR domain-containing protein [Actinomycetota bacterium]|nr:GAF and ANTAR domain-containing protein [Actinomycetota bacterium]
MPMTDRAQVLAKLATTLASLDPGRPLTWRICESARVILGCDGGAITFDYTSRSRVTVAATDDISERLEDLQDVLGEGPGADAFTTGTIVSTHLDDAAQDRWPGFTAAAEEAFGQLAIFAVPMRPNNSVLGVLTVYKTELVPLDATPHSVQFLGDAVGATLLRDPQSQTDVDEAGGGSWSSRAPINQAVGMVVAQLAIAPDDALALLRAHTFAHNTDLLSIAADTIQRRIDFSNFNVSGD